MGIAEGIAAVSLVVGAASAKKARDEQKAAQKDDKRAQREQRAMAAQQAAQERRQQVREERVRRAQIMQASASSGVSGSSGEIGATSSLSTQLGSNLGYNLSMGDMANRSSSYMQSAAGHRSRAADYAMVQQFSTSIFQAAGGFNSLLPSTGGTQAPAPVETRSFG